MGTARHNFTWLAQNHANLLHLVSCLRLNPAHRAQMYDRAFKQASKLRMGIANIKFLIIHDLQQPCAISFPVRQNKLL